MADAPLKWGPFPSVEEVSRHAARHGGRLFHGATWMRRYHPFAGCDEFACETARLDAYNGRVLRHSPNGAWLLVVESETRGEWRPIDVNGEAVER